MYYKIPYSCISHKGKIREKNQDNFFCNGQYIDSSNTNIEYPINGYVNSRSPSFFGVFDGLGGEACGEIASFIAAKKASELNLRDFSESLLSNFCKEANSEICLYAKRNAIKAMGTTAAIMLFEKKKIQLCNIGDSRIYRYRKDSLDIVSKDHVFISVYGKKPSLSQNLGIPETEMIIEPFFAQEDYIDGDKYLICSDGLTDMLTDEEIKSIIKDNDIYSTTELLTEKSLENGGKDNITIILLEINAVKGFLSNLF